MSTYAHTGRGAQEAGWAGRARSRLGEARKKQAGRGAQEAGWAGRARSRLGGARTKHRFIRLKKGSFFF
eukprot:SAG11_NODE_20874_length_436_cov_2.293769_1_plen_68_part_01